MSSARSLLLVEFVAAGRTKRAVAFPYALGFARESGVHAEWLRYGVPADRRAANGEEGVGLAAADLDDLAARVDQAAASGAGGGGGPRLCIALGQRPADEVLARIRAGAPPARIAVAAGPDGWTDAAPGLPVLPLDRPAWAEFMGLPDCAHGSLFESTPDFGYVAANEAARLEPPLPYLSLGPWCGHRLPLSSNATYAGLDLGTVARPYGCAFCALGQMGIRGPAFSRAAASRQLLALARTAPPAQGRLVVRLAGEAWLIHAPDAVRAIIATPGLAAADWLLDGRADTIVRCLPRLAEAARLIEGSGHRLHVSLVGVENFSRDELARMNKGFGPLTGLSATRGLLELEKERPAGFGFRRFGGLSTILFTPWTRLHDLALNLAVIRGCAIEDLAPKLLGSRLRLMPGLPMTELAAAEGLLAERYDDPVLDTAALSLYGAETPWRFADAAVEPVCRLLVRLAHPGLSDPLSMRVQATFERAAAVGRGRTDLAAAIVDASEAANMSTPGGEPPAPEKTLAAAEGLLGLTEGKATGAPDPASPAFRLLVALVREGAKPVARIERLRPDEARLLAGELPNARVRRRRAPDGLADLVFGADARDVARVDDLSGIIEERPDDDPAFGPAVREVGRLLGYPPCCAEAFAARGSFGQGGFALAHVTRRLATPAVDPAANPWLFGVTAHVWCRPDCGPSLEGARAACATLASVLGPGGSERVAAAAANPWLALTGLDGAALELVPDSPPGERFRFRAGALTRDHPLLRRASSADELVAEPDRLLLLERGRPVLDLTARAFVWWHERVLQRELWEHIVSIRRLAEEAARAATASRGTGAGRPAAPRPPEPERELDGGPAARRLLGDLPSRGIGGFVLQGSTVRRSLELDFARGTDRLRVWIAPADAETASFRRTRMFKVGYRGHDLDAGGAELLDAIARRLEETERRLSDRECREALTSVRDAADLKVLDGVLELRVTRRCNEACPFCNSMPFADNQVLSPAAVADAIAAAPGLGARSVVFTGGEPTLEPDLPAWVRAARALGLRTEVQTNGIVPCEPGWWANWRDDAGRPSLPDALMVSFHTRRPGRVETLTGVAGTLARKVATVRTALALGIDVWLNFVVTTANLDEVAGFPAHVARTFGGGPGLVFSVVAPTGRAAMRPDLLPAPSIVAKRLRRGLDAALRAGMRALVPELCGLPICYLPDRSEHFRAAARTVPLQLAGDDHIKGAACRSCRWDRTCPGLWKAYAELFGPPPGPGRTGRR